MANTEHRVTSLRSERHRTRRLSVQSHNSVESEGSFIDSDRDLMTFTDSDTDDTDDVPRYMQLNGEQFLVTDSWGETNNENDLLEVIVDNGNSSVDDGNSPFFGIWMV